MLDEIQALLEDFPNAARGVQAWLEKYECSWSILGDVGLIQVLLEKFKCRSMNPCVVG
jgi:hypothetical protein